MAGTLAENINPEGIQINWIGLSPWLLSPCTAMAVWYMDPGSFAYGSTEQASTGVTEERRNFIH